MLVDITEFPYSQLRPNGFVVIRVPAVGLNDPAVIDSLTKGLRERVDDSVQVVILRDDMSLEVLDEQKMNEAGWFRSITVPAAPPKVVAPQCPFSVGDTIHEISSIGYTTTDIGSPFDEDLSPPTLDESRPDAVVTALTERGFAYEYAYPTPIGRAEWGQMLTGGECFVDGYYRWRKVGGTE